MAAFLRGLVLLPVAIVVVLLAVANRAPVTLSLDPFSREVPAFAATVPLFAALFAATALGILLGGIGAWLAQGKHRRARRDHRREIEVLRTRIAVHERAERERAERERALAAPALAPPLGAFSSAPDYRAALPAPSAGRG